MKKLTVNFPGAVLALALGIGAGTAQATIIFDSLTSDGTTLTTTGSFVSSTGSSPFGQAFTTGALVSTIDSISLYGYSLSGGSTTTLKIYSDLGGAPSAVVETLTNPTVTTSAGTNTFTGTSTVLTASTTYWAVLANTDNAKSTKWYYSSQAVSPSILGYENGDTEAGTWGVQQSSALAMQVNASAVPEPSTDVLAGVGLAALGWMRRRRNSGAQTGSTAGLMPA